jgi:GR25 family glycosyltransferase involved in LPS biosynthesis
LGYKVRDPHNYDHVSAGSPQKLETRQKHGGAHAYALTPKGAQALIQNIEQNGLSTMVDNHYFLRVGKKEKTHVLNLAITDPICALGWLRESTIWKRAAVDNYRPILKSFTEHYKSNEDLGLKGS